MPPTFVWEKGVINLAQDPYNVLGVSKGADMKEVRQAYRKLAKQYHPDKNPNDKAAEEKFKQVSAAFNFLDDDERKGKFDRGEIDADGNPKFAGFGGGGNPFGGGSYSGSSGFGGGDPFGPGGPFAGMNMGGGKRGGSSGYGNPDFEDLFGDLFGANVRGATRGGTTRPPSKGQDLKSNIDVETIDVIKGGKKRINVNGSTIEITIPSGVTDGQVLRVRGKGSPSATGGANGDLLVTVKIIPDGKYRIEGLDVHTDLPISLYESIKGGKVEAQTPLGNVVLTVKPNANSGQILRLKGRGIAKGDKIGNLYFHLQIMLPDGDNSELLDLIDNWSKKEEKPKKRES